MKKNVLNIRSRRSRAYLRIRDGPAILSTRILSC
nr:MAG TPA: hypothetical protein [Caudoviricetes sp.]